MSAAFVAVCNAIGLTNRADDMAELVARHIIEAAQRGIKSKTALYLVALERFKANPM